MINDEDSNILYFSEESFDESNIEESSENYNDIDEDIWKMGDWKIDPCKYRRGNQPYGPRLSLNFLMNAMSCNT